jgi:HK97 family phage major capsid protein
MKRLQSIKVGRQFREVSFQRDTVDVESRTATMAFSSETPVQRYYGNEILDHGPSSVRLGRLTSGAPLLMDHDGRDQVGVVESATIGPDRVGRAVVRFGKSQRASEVWQDVVDGIRTKISVGYMVHNMISDDDGDEGVTDGRSSDGDGDECVSYRVTDWEPFEVSVVSIPADNSVGIGRSDEGDTKEIFIQTRSKEKIMKEKVMFDARGNKVRAMVDDNEKIVEVLEVLEARALPAEPKQAVDVNAVRADVLAVERKRISDMESIAEPFKAQGGIEMAREFIASGKSVDDFRSALLDKVGKKAVPSADIGLTEKEIRSFSFLRAMRAMADGGTNKRLLEDAAYEFEVSNAAAAARGVDAKGIFVPEEVLRHQVMGDMQARAMNAGSFGAGGASVATNLMPGSFIDILRNKSILSQLGVTDLGGLVGDVAIPRQAAAATAYWVSEGGAPTGSQAALDQVTLRPKTLAAYTDVTRKLMYQSTPDAENMIRTDLAKVLALAGDLAGLYGTGKNNQPLGVANTKNIQTVAFAAGGAPTWNEIVTMETKVAQANADLEGQKYAVSAFGRGYLKSTPKVGTTFPVFLWEGGKVNDYDVAVSNQILNADYWFGAWSQMVSAMWSGVDMMIDPYTFSSSGTVRIVVMQDRDYAVRHPQSFCLGH